MTLKLSNTSIINTSIINLIRCSGHHKDMVECFQKGLIMDVAMSNFDVAGPDFANLLVLREANGKVWFHKL